MDLLEVVVDNVVGSLGGFMSCSRRSLYFCKFLGAALATSVIDIASVEDSDSSISFICKNRRTIVSPGHRGNIIVMLNHIVLGLCSGVDCSALTLCG